MVKAGVRDGRLRLRRRTRRLAVTALSVLLSLSLCVVGARCWLSEKKSEHIRTEAESACVRRVNEMTESYNRASLLYGQVSSKFGTLDESYDLDALAELLGERPERYRTLECSADTDGDGRTAVLLKRSYDELSERYARALSTTDE